MSELIKLKNAVKCKFLFRSEDKVDIYEGDEYYVVNFKYVIYSNSDYIYTHNNAGQILSTFSTKEAAQKYIDLNKPKYSELEMIKATDEAYEAGCNESY